MPVQFFLILTFMFGSSLSVIVCKVESQDGPERESGKLQAYQPDLGEVMGRSS